jgi:hypothetical protein
MWNLLKKNDECGKLLDLLEEVAGARPKAKSVGELTEALSPAERTHIASCKSCLEAAQDLLDAREIFKGVASDKEMARPWFATDVMAAIAAREKELSEAASAWLAVPKFALRLAVASGALLLVVAGTWLYQRPVRAPSQQISAVAAQESLFEAPSSVNQDDVFVPVQENNP